MSFLPVGSENIIDISKTLGITSLNKSYKSIIDLLKEIHKTEEIAETDTEKSDIDFEKEIETLIKTSQNTLTLTNTDLTSYGSPGAKENIQK